MIKILFVCVENSCRSQIAEALGRQYAKGQAEVFSAGSKPSGVVNPNAIAVMKEAGIDLQAHNSKGFAQLLYQKFDYVITMGCQDQCPFVPAEKALDWQIEDPRGKDLAFFRKTRDQIAALIQEFFKEERVIDNDAESSSRKAADF